MKKTIAIASIFLFTNQIALAEEFKLTIAGDASIYGFYKKVISESSIGLDGKINANLAKNLDNGTIIGGNLEAETPNKLSGYGYYKFGLGEVKLGSMKITAHGVSVPNSPDAMDMKFLNTAFSNVPKEVFGGISLPEFSPALTYSTNKIAGIKLGVGLRMETFDAAIAANYNINIGKIKFGAGYSGNYNATDKGVVRVGANIDLGSLELGTKITQDLAATTNPMAAEIGGNFDIGLINLGVKYTLGDISILDRGAVTAGAKITMGDLLLGANIKQNNNVGALDTQAITKFGAKYTMGMFTLGSSGEYKLNDETLAVNSGVDFKLNNNITIGGGVSYNHSQEISGAAGIRFKF